MPMLSLLSSFAVFAQASGSGTGPPERLPVFPAAGSNGGILPVR